MSASFPPGEWMVEILQMLSSMFSSKNSNWVRMKLYFIMLLGLGMMPANRFPWQVSHHLQLKGKEKWAPKVPAYSPPCQIAVPFQSSWARGWARDRASPYLWSPALMKIPCAPWQSLDQGIRVEKRGQGLKIYFSYSQFWFQLQLAWFYTKKGSKALARYAEKDG